MENMDIAIPDNFAIDVMLPLFIAFCNPPIPLLEPSDEPPPPEPPLPPIIFSNFDNEFSAILNVICTASCADI